MPFGRCRQFMMRQIQIIANANVDTLGRFGAVRRGRTDYLQIAMNMCLTLLTISEASSTTNENVWSHIALIYDPIECCRMGRMGMHIFTLHSFIRSTNALRDRKRRHRLPYAQMKCASACECRSDTHTLSVLSSVREYVLSSGCAADGAGRQRKCDI